MTTSLAKTSAEKKHWDNNTYGVKLIETVLFLVSGIDLSILTLDLIFKKMRLRNANLCVFVSLTAMSLEKSFHNTAFLKFNIYQNIMQP